MITSSDFVNTEEDIQKQKDTIAEAIEKGFNIIYSNKKYILLDIDNVLGWLRFKKVLPEVEKLYKVRNKQAYRSKSGNIHVVIEITSTLDSLEQVAIQAILGSDPVRELISLRRISLGDPNYSQLFQPRNARSVKWTEAFKES